MHTSSRRELLLPTTGNDADVIRALLELEREAVHMYGFAAKRLDGTAGRLARRIREQERAHSDGLARSVHRLGQAPPHEGMVEMKGLRRAVDEGGPAFARFAAARESRVVAAYLRALGRLRRPGLCGPVASILANEAQHLTLLREYLGRDPVPSAYESGISRPLA